jgi:integrase
MVKAWGYRTEQLFTRIRLERSVAKTMDDSTIKKLVSDWLTKTLNEAEEGRLRGVGLLEEYDEDGEHGLDPQEGLDLHLTDLKENLARGRYGAVAHIVEELLIEHQLNNVSAEDRLKLSREVLKSVIDGTSTELERMRGHYSATLSYPSPVQAPAPAAVPDPATPVLLLSSLIDEYLKENKTSQKWSTKTATEVEAILMLFVEVVGDRDVAGLNHKTLNHYRDVLLKLPANMRHNKAYRGKTVEELVALNVSPTLSLTTVNKHISRIGSLLRFAVRRGYVAANYAEGLTVRQRNTKPSEERDAYALAELRRLISSPVFTSPDPSRPERLWGILIGLYGGLRIGEAAQLYLDDIVEIDGVACFKVSNEREDQKVKTTSSSRIVPVHPVLIELGLLDFISALRKRGAARLFENLQLRRDGFGHSLSVWYGRYRQKHLQNSRLTFHGFRHTFTNALKDALVPDAVIAELIGHAHKGITMSRYGKSYNVKVLKEALEKLEYGVEGELRKLPRLNATL